MPDLPSPSANQFRAECDRLFSKHGRNWKTTCAKALSIGRATLYRYFENESRVPEDVRRRLMCLTAPDKPPIDSHRMIRLYARALVDLQRNLDEPTNAGNPYPRTLIRAFDRAAALNSATSSQLLPVELPDFLTWAQKPLYEWGIDLSWDPHGDWTAMRLVANGTVTAGCFELAARGEDPEAELKEQEGYEHLRRLCLERSDGEDFYRPGGE